MKKMIFNISIIILVAKLMGFFREVALSYFFGASSITDAYLIALTIPTIIFNFIGIGLNSTYIPMYSRIKEGEGEENAIAFTTNFLNFLLIICTIIYIIGLLFTPELINIFASGFRGETLMLAIKYTRICFIGVYVTVLISVFSGFLQVHNKFYTVALMSIPMNIIYIFGSYYASIKGDIYLPLISVIAILAQVTLLLVPIKKSKYKYNFSINLKDQNLKQILQLSIPAIIGGSLEQINYLIDKTVASRILIGGVSILNYASKLNIAIIGMFLSTILAVLYPKISLLAAENDLLTLKKHIDRTINCIFIISVPIVFGILIFSKEIIEVIFGRGAFSQDAVQMTSQSLFCYTLGFLAMLIRELMTRIFYSFKDTRTPLLNSGIGIVLNIGLNISLSKYLGLMGIALATSLSAIITTLLLTFSLEKKYYFSLLEGMKFIFFRTLICSLGMSIILLIVKYYFSIYSNYLLIVIAGVVGIFSYGFFILFTDIEEVHQGVEILKKFIKKKRNN